MIVNWNRFFVSNFDRKDFQTSDEWVKELNQKTNVIITDPDGWDRSNFQYSFYEEKIDFNEFTKRFLKSTIFLKK